MVQLLLSDCSENMLKLIALLVVLVPGTLGQKVDHFKIVDILSQCWRQSPVIVLDPQPMSDDVLNQMALEKSMMGGADVSILEASASTTLKDLMSLAKMRGTKFLLVFNALALDLPNFGHDQKDLGQIFSEMTWTYPSTMDILLNNIEARLDTKLLSFSEADQEISVSERFGFKSEVVHFNRIGWMNSSHHIACARKLSLDERRSQFLGNKTLHFASVTPHLEDPESFQAAERQGIIISGSSLVLRELLYDVASNSGLNLKETSIFDSKYYEGRDLVWESILKLASEDETIDLVTEAFVKTFERQKFTDFTIDILALKIPFHVQARERQALNFTVYFKMFSFPLWLAIILVITCTAILLAIIDTTLTRKSHKSAQNLLKTFCAWFFRLFLQLLQKDMIDLPQCIKEFKESRLKCAKHILLFFTSCSSYILFSLYASCLTSVLSSPPLIPSQIQRVQDLLLPNVEIGLAGPFSLSLFEEAREGSIWREIFFSKFANREVKYLNGKDEIRNFLLASKNAVFLGVHEPENEAMLRTIGSEVLSSNAMLRTVAFPMSNGSQFGNILSFNFRKLAEAGITQRRMTTWSRGLALLTHESRQRGKNGGQGVVKLTHVTFPFLVLVLGMILSLVLVIIEKAAYARAKNVQQIHPMV